MKIIKNICILSFIALSLSCSSTKKRPMKITTVSDNADSKYETANSALLSGNLERAQSLFVQAYNMAYSVDNADLLCRIALSAISFKIESGNLDAKKGADDFINGESAEDILKNAKYFAEKTERKDFLLAVCTIYDARLELCRDKKNVQVFESNLLAAEKTLEKEPFYQAHLYRTLGDVRIISKDYAGAESAYSKAADLHTKNRYVSEIGTDWYGVSRARSLAGNKDGAITAMEEALKYDRASENTAAIASDYFACAKILAKGNASADEKKRAKEFALWAAAVFRAGGFEEEAKECEKFQSNIK